MPSRFRYYRNEFRPMHWVDLPRPDALGDMFAGRSAK